MQIMVRTIGFGRVLGRAIRKALWRRETSDNDNDCPQWRRPTASACRQRQQARVVEDPQTAVEDLNEKQQQPPIEEGVTDVEGFSGGPHDTSVLRDFENHIALRVWNGKVCNS